MIISKITKLQNILSNDSSNLLTKLSEQLITKRTIERRKVSVVIP